MYQETNFRSIIKGFSWRIIATLTTVIIIYVFFGELELAIVAGFIETIFKVILYWAHERIWFKIRWGRKRIEPFNVWLTGLPLSGKTTIGDKVFEELQKLDIPIERIDSKDIRSIIPNIGYSKDERIQHIQRVGHLIKTLQNNSISTVCSFVSPYQETREIIKSMAKNTICVYIKSDIETCKKRDYKGYYQKALNGEIEDFTGISAPFQEPQKPDIVINSKKISPDEASKMIIKFIKDKYIG